MKQVKTLFAENLNRLRKESGLSQKRLAELAGLTHNFINDLENMKKGGSFKTIDQLSAALRVEPVQFFIDPAHLGNNEDANLLAIIDHLKKNMNKMFDNYQRKA